MCGVAGVFLYSNCSMVWHCLFLLQGRKNSWFCGSYTLVNTHEIAIISGLAVAERLGAPYPFQDDKLALKQFETYLRCGDEHTFEMYISIHLCVCTCVRFQDYSWPQTPIQGFVDDDNDDDKPMDTHNKQPQTSTLQLLSGLGTMSSQAHTCVRTRAD